MLVASFLVLLAVGGHCQNLTKTLEVGFDPEGIEKLHSDDSTKVRFWTSDLSDDDIEHGVVTIVSRDPGVAKVLPESTHYILKTQPFNGSLWTSEFVVGGLFLGHTSFQLTVTDRETGEVMRVSNPLEVTVVRPNRAIDRAFPYSVGTLVSIIYINFGCALDWEVLKKTLRRPIGPVIGLFSQFVFMPVIAFLLGKAIFPGSPTMQLGLFFTGVSPAGGASNIWTYALDGNLNLSITMTTLSTFAAFALMPMWIFSLGHLIFTEGKMMVPYSRIGTIALGLIVPLAVGLLIQKFFPRVSKFMVRIMKPFSALLIIFIVVFAIVTNFYLFQLFSWQIIVAGLGLPWLGFLGGFVVARLCKQPCADVLAIAIETGVQNTGIAIFMLSFSLGQPEADLTTVVPVSVAVLTPLPLLLLLTLSRLRRCILNTKPGYEMEPLDQQDPKKLPISPTQENDSVFP